MKKNSLTKIYHIIWSFLNLDTLQNDRLILSFVKDIYRVDHTVNDGLSGNLRKPAGNLRDRFPAGFQQVSGWFPVGFRIFY